MAKKETTKKKATERKGKKKNEETVVEQPTVKTNTEETKEEPSVKEELVEEKPETINLVGNEINETELKETINNLEENNIETPESEVFVSSIIEETIEEIKTKNEDNAHDEKSKKIIDAYMKGQTNQYEELPLVPMKRNPKNIFFKIKETIKRKLNFGK